MFIAKVTIVNVIKPFVTYTPGQISLSVCLLTKYNYLLERPEAYPLSEAPESLQTFLKMRQYLACKYTLAYSSRGIMIKKTSIICVFVTQTAQNICLLQAFTT